MVTDLQTKPPEDDQKAVGKEFDSMVDSGAMGDDPEEEKSLSPEAIGDLEAAADNPEENDPGGESDQVGSGYTGGGGKKNGSGKKKLVIGGSIGAVLVGGIIGIMAFLQPFFLTHIVNFIETQVGQVPQYAVERRMEYYMNRYLIMRTVGNTGTSIDGDSRFTYMGDGFIRTMYTNWQGARLEEQMIQGGTTLEGNNVEGLSKTSMRADRWELVERGSLDASGNPRRTNLSAPEARKWVRQYSRDTTSNHQLWKRHTIRKHMKRYNGVPNWKIFEKTRENVRDAYRAKKLSIKRKMINRVTSRLGEKSTVWLNCILHAEPDACTNKKIHEANDNVSSVEPNSDQADEIDNTLDGNDPDADSPDVDAPGRPSTYYPDGRISRLIFRLLEKEIIKQILASVALGAGFLDTLSKVVLSVEDGALNKVTYARAVESYSAFSAPVLSAADQFRSGQDFDKEDLHVMSDMFKGFQASPVYQSTQTSTARANEGKSIHRDCNNDGDTTDTGDALKPGEVVCPGKKALHDNTDFITNNEAWPVLVNLANAWNNSGGKVIGYFVSLVDAITSALRVDDLTNALVGALGIEDSLSDAFGFLMNHFFGIVVTGAEVGPDAFDAVYGGIAAASVGAAGGVGDRTGNDSTLGAGVVNDGEVLEMTAEMQEQRDYELKNMGTFARYFSPNNTESLTSYAIINNPGVNSGALQRFAGVFKISNFTSLVSNLASREASAADINKNPFGYINYGFAPSHPIFSAHNGDGMDPEEVVERYKCDLPPEERPQNQVLGRPTMTNGERLPFDVNTEGDPCMLEEAVVKAATMRFTGEYDDDIDGGDSDSANGALPTGTVTAADIVAIPGLEFGCHRSIAANVTRMIQDAASAGVVLTGSCWRSPESQIALRIAHCGPTQYDIYERPSGECSPPTAIPGTSNHERGLAIDFDNCHHGSACFNWLSANAARYGLQNLPSESWHWSVDGG